MAEVAAGDGPLLLDAEQVRDRLIAEWKMAPDAVKINQVRQWMRKGDLYVVALGNKKWYTPRADVDRFARELVTPPERAERQAS